MSDLLRLYGPAECGPDSYPYAWHRSTAYGNYPADHSLANPAIKDLVRLDAGHRCERCRHPYRSGEHGNGEWSPCDEQCSHAGPTRIYYPTLGDTFPSTQGVPSSEVLGRMAETGETHQGVLEAAWRILTVHHLNGVKWDCRWWNLAALCQRCHLTIQGRVVMERVYPFEHSEWFKPHVAAWYAADYLGEDLTREQTLARLDELLALERVI